jgi:multiple sugar transport system permease protein
MTAPAFASIILVTLVPIAFSAYMSLNKVSVGAGGMNYAWAGLGNYQAVLRSGAMQYAVAFTVLYTVVTVAAELAIGLAVAVVLDRMTAGRPVVLALLLIPWAMITVISGELWGYIFNGVYGVASAMLVWLHIASHPISFLGSPVPAIATLAFADAWKTIPFVAIVLLGGLRMIDRELYAAAAVDGAGKLRTLFRITFPLLRPAFATAAVFRVLQAFGLFDLPFVLTQGGPGHSTQSVAILAYNVMFQDLNFGAGSAIATITTLLVLIAAIALLRVFRFQADETGR